MSDAAPAFIDDATVALVESAHAAKVLAAAGADRRATLVHAYACRVDPDRRRVHVTVDRAQAGPLLATLLTGSRIALVACHIQTFQSLQLKGDEVRLVEPGPEERLAATAHSVEFARFAATLGHPEAMMRAHMQCHAQDVAALVFTVRQAFVQTPGPTAGQPLAVRS